MITLLDACWSRRWYFRIIITATVTRYDPAQALGRGDRATDNKDRCEFRVNGGLEVNDISVDECCFVRTATMMVDATPLVLKLFETLRRLDIRPNELLPAEA